MTSVITGDIIKSRQNLEPKKWQEQLKSTLKKLSQDKSNWQLYRGDSFQIEIKNPSDSFKASLLIKASLKTIKNLDVRLAIGIGNKTYTGSNVSESSGDAFINSGEIFETLKETKQNLKIKTPNTQINKELNLYFKLALITIDQWSTNSAEAVMLQLLNPEATQTELAKKINTTQNAISKRLKRAHYNEMEALNQMYQYKIKTLKHASN